MGKEQEILANRHYKKTVSTDSFVKFPLSFCAKFKITPTDCAIWSIVHQATVGLDLKCYCGSVEQMRTKLFLSAPTVRTSLERLHNLGLVRKTTKVLKDKSGRIKTWVCYVSRLNLNSEIPLDEQVKIELIQRAAVGIGPIVHKKRTLKNAKGEKKNDKTTARKSK